MALDFSKRRMADLFRTCLSASSRKTGADWTRKYTGLIEAAREVEIENAIIDGKASGTRRSTAQRVEETAKQWARGGETAYQAPPRRAYPTSFCAVYQRGIGTEVVGSIGWLKGAAALHTSLPIASRIRRLLPMALSFGCMPFSVDGAFLSLVEVLRANEPAFERS